MPSHSDEPITRTDVDVLFSALGYKFDREQGGFLLWSLVKRPERARVGSWPDQLCLSTPHRTLRGSPELVFDRDVIADAIQYVTGDGPFEVVHRISGILKGPNKRQDPAA